MKTTRPERITLREIAAEVGCSIGTVSHVLNGSQGNIGVSPDMRERIAGVADRLGYAANYHARALRTGQSQAIGLLAPSPNTGLDQTHYRGLLTTGVDLQTRRGGCDLLLIGPAQGESALDRGARHLRQGRIDGLIVPGYMHRPGAATLPPGRVVALLPRGPVSVPAVHIDEHPGAAAAVRHLAGLGHREILWINEAVDGALRLPRRRDGVLAAARDCGVCVREMQVPVVPIHRGSTISVHVRTARSVVAEHLPGLGPFTAVMAFNELMAIGAQAALLEAGLKVPEDVSLVGFDDIFAETTTPPMTVVSHCLLEAGQAAADLALAMLAPGSSHPVPASIAVPTRLVVRGSTAAASPRPNRKPLGP